ncbi:MAG: alpha/beta hydrolase [Balneolaceae bacterium]
MNTETFTIENSNGEELYTYQWTPESSHIRGVVQIAHGMAEHAGRYSHLAEKLTEKNFAVVAHDHPGHGETDPDDRGFISGGNGFRRMVDTIIDVKKTVEKHFPDLPRFLFGHSMGSFLIQRHLQLTDDKPAGVIYSGSNGHPPGSIRFGILLSRFLMMIFGPDAKSPLLNKLTFGSYNKPFEPARTEFDWLSRDESEVDRYIEDPKCGFICSTSFYHDLFKGLIELHRYTPFTGYTGNAPILIQSGDKDPVSEMGKGIDRLRQSIMLSGTGNPEIKLYEGARHEIYHETNREEVISDLLEWLESQLDV